MTDVKWIKIIIDPFSDGALNRLESLNDDEVIVVWFKLLSMMAIRLDLSAYTFIDRMPYTDKLLSRAIRMDEGAVLRALAMFNSLNMIEITTDQPEATGV
jgi:hypothetical protein